MQAAIYARVSTGKQAQQELSIPDQIAQCEAFCVNKGWTVAKTFIDAGRSGTTDNRPDFQALIAEACSSAKPFDVILVHSQSRFARNLEDLLHYRRRLETAGVALVCITQDLGDGDAANLALTMMGVMDEYQSKEISKHVSRAMIENARQGFWNGAMPPFGYRTYVAETRGKKDKKKLEIDPRTAEIVRMVFKLYVEGDGRSGPIGIKQIVDYLNSRNFTNALGSRFRIQTIQKVLRNTAYIGQHHFNRRNNRTKQIRPKEEWILFETPRLIDDATFYAAQEKLDRQHPLKTPPRVVNSDIVLTGIAHCANCCSPLRIQTGKSGAYKYYKCSRRADEGASACKGCSIPMAKLDELVLTNIADRVLSPERLNTILPALVERTTNAQSKRLERLRDVRGEQRKLRSQVGTLYDQVGSGSLDMDSTLSSHIRGLQSRIDDLVRSEARLERECEATAKPLSKASVNRFAGALRTRLLDQTDTKLARAYVRLMLSEVVVGKDKIEMRGSDTILAAQAAQFADQDKLVPSFDQEWRTGEDSNSRPLDS